MDPITGASTGAKALPPLVRELRKLRRRDEVRNIFGAVAKMLASDYRVPAEHRREVMRRVRGLPLDPTLGGALRALLEGDSSVLAGIEARASELLRFGEEVDDRAVVRAFMQAVRASVIEARRDVPAALSTIYREQLTGTEMLGEVSRRLEEGAGEAQQSEQRIIEAIQSQARPGGSAALSLITGAATLAPQTPKVLRELGEHDSAMAEEAVTVLAQSGGHGLASWAEQSTARLRGRGAQTVSDLGRLLMAENRFAAAERLFVIAAEDDAEDPARQWVRAANAALQDGREARSRELLETARGLAPHTHPAIALADVQWQGLSPNAVLERLRGVQPLIDADVLGLASARAQVALRKEDLEGAGRALEEAERVDAEEQRVRELRALWHLQRAHARMLAGSEPDPADLSAGERGFVSLREEMRRRERPDESGGMLSRAVEVRLVARRISDATELLQQASESERRGKAGLALARQALLCGQSELALELIGAAPATEESSVIEASVNVTSDDPELRRQALETLDGLLFSADEEVRAEAALARTAACLDQEEPAQWSERAGEILAERDGAAAAILRARAHLARHEFEAAEAILRRYAECPEGLNALIDSAAMQGDFQTALKRSDLRMRRRPDAEASYQHARLLQGAGREAEALEEFAKVAGAREALLPGQREDAFMQALGLAQRLERFREMQELAQEALEQGLDGDDLHWARALARFMLSRHAEALKDLDAAGVQAATLPQAELLSRILYQVAEPAEALRRSAVLSARFGRPEGLEALLIVMSPRAEQLDPQTEMAVREAFETFAARFPNSKRIIQRELPGTEEGIRQLLAEMAPAGDRDREIMASVRDGSTVTAVLAAVHGRSLSELWAALTMLPLGYGEATLDALGLQDARRALASPAVLDPSSLSVLALLGEDASQAVLRALPGAQIPQATLQDADRGVNPMNDPRAPAGAVVRDPRSGEPVVIANDPEESERRAARQREHLRLAQALEVEPDAQAGGEHELERALLAGEPPMDAALRTWAATVTLAGRGRLAVLSDDRRVRLYARAEGLPSFGTLALLRSLMEAGDISEELFHGARAALLGAGGVGLHPDGQELAGLVRGERWEPSRSLYTLLSDPSFWEPDGIAAWGAAGVLLTAVQEEAPERLGTWVARLVDAAKQANLNLNLDVLCFGLLATVWGWTTASQQVDRQLLQAVIEALRGLPAHLGEGPRVDPVVYALARFANISERAPRAQRAFFALRAIALLRISDQLTALDLLWE
ncbi:MAG: PIN domain-containing protein [Solirubrobacteraceae bacterium]